MTEQERIAVLERELAETKRLLHLNTAGQWLQMAQQITLSYESACTAANRAGKEGEAESLVDFINRLAAERNAAREIVNSINRITQKFLLEGASHG